MIAGTPWTDFAPAIAAVIVGGAVYALALYTRWRFDRQRALEARGTGATGPSFRRDLKALDDLILKLTREPQARRAEALAKVWAAKEALLAAVGEAAPFPDRPRAADRHAAE
jgi:hypothetical protein